MEGNGFSFKYLDAQQQVYYKTHIQWPPLYPLVLSLVSFLTANTLLSSFIIQISVLLFLVIIWKKIFNFFKNIVTEEAYFYFISLLIISTSILNNINTILVVALLILSLSIYFMFAYLFLDKSRKLNLFLSSLFASMLFWTHYSYFLTAFYPTVVLIIIFIIDKDKNNLYAAIRSFVISLTITSGVLIYNYLTTGFINYMDNPDIWIVGFYPEKILRMDPFFVKAFFNSGYLPDNLFFFSKNYHGALNLLFHVVSLGLIAFIIISLIRLKRNKRVTFKNTYQLVVPFFVIILTTISFLFYFTLRYHEIPNPGLTHIADGRYLSAIYLAVIAIIVTLIFVKTDHINKKIIYTVKGVLISLIIINLFINISLIVEHWNIHNFRGRNNKTERDYDKLFDSIYRESDVGKQPIFINNSQTGLSVRVSQYVGAAVINASDVIRN